MLVEEIMTIPVVSIPSSENYQTALRLMQSRHVHHLPVVDSNGRLCGIIAERDMLRAASAYMNTIAEVDLVMQRNVQAILPHIPITDAARIMLKQRIGCLPVTDERGHLLGMVTEGDMLAAMLTLNETPPEPLHEQVVGT